MRTWCYGTLVVAAICWCCSAVYAAPAVDFEKTVFDFGKITTGQKGKAVFAFKNTGDQPLEVTKIFAICKCTKAIKSSIPKIAPGKSEKIEIAFDSAGLQGKVVKRVLVKTNDSTHEKTLLTVQADVQPIANLTPGSVNFGSLKPNGQYETTVTLTPTTAKSFKVLKVTPGTNSSIAKFVQAKDGKGSYKLSVIVKAGSQSARVMDELKIVTDLPGKPSITLLVYGNVEKEVTEDAAGS